MTDQNSQNADEPMDQDSPETIPIEPVPPPSEQEVLVSASSELAFALQIGLPTVETDFLATEVDPAPSNDSNISPGAAGPQDVLEVQLNSLGPSEYEKLLAKELLTVGLQVDEYVVLILIDLLRFNNEAHFTLYRAKQAHPKSDIILNLLFLVKFLKTSDAAENIKRTRFLLTKYKSFRLYFEEFINRLTVYTVFAVAKTYTTIQVKQLQILLAFPNNFAEILEELQWPIVNDFVNVFNNDLVVSFAKNHINTDDFGPFNVLPQLSEEPLQFDSPAADSVQKILAVSDALSKIKMPPPKISEGKENSEKSGSTPPESV